MTIEPIDKVFLLKQVEEKLREDLEAVLMSQKVAQEGATQTESKQEGSKDMRSTEQSYIARGLAKRAEEIQESLLRMTQISLGVSLSVKMGSLVYASLNEEEQKYFLLPVGGGLSIKEQGETVRVVTHQSPIGRALLGLSVDDEASFERPSGVVEISVLEIY